MENKIDCATDIRTIQAADVISGCIERIQRDMRLNVLDIALAVDIVAGKLQRQRADLYAQAFAAGVATKESNDTEVSE